MGDVYPSVPAQWHHPARKTRHWQGTLLEAGHVALTASAQWHWNSTPHFGLPLSGGNPRSQRQVRYKSSEATSDMDETDEPSSEPGNKRTDHSARWLPNLKQARLQVGIGSTHQPAVGAFQSFCYFSRTEYLEGSRREPRRHAGGQLRVRVPPLAAPPQASPDSE